MARRSRTRLAKLDEMEREFRSLLLFSLEECASGEWGLFGQNDHCVPQLSPAEPTRLQELAQEIQSIRAESGERNDLCEQFLYLSSLRGSNVAGEPKLAATFLSEIGEGKYS